MHEKKFTIFGSHATKSAVERAAEIIFYRLRPAGSGGSFFNYLIHDYQRHPGTF